MIGPAIRGVWKKLRVQIDRRGDIDIPALRAALTSSHYDEAIQVLVAEPGIENVGERIKAFLSDRPAIFDDQDSRDWLCTDQAKELVKKSVEALIDDREIDEEIEAASALYERLNGDSGWRGGDLLIQATGFVAKSVLPSLTLDTRVVLDAQRRNFARVEDQLSTAAESMTAGIKEVIDRLDASGIQNAASPPIKASPDAAEVFVRSELRKQRRRLALDQGEGAAPAGELASRAWDRDLTEASAEAKGSAFKAASASYSRNDDPDSAQLWLDRAISVGVADVVAERARILIARGNATEALHLLDGQTDSESVAVSLNAVNKRDGSTAAVEFFRSTYLRGHLNGHSLAQVSRWLAETGRVAEAEELLTSATESQIEDNPVLLLTRARTRLALCAGPSAASELATGLSILPAPSTLRDDSAAAAFIAGARADVLEFRRVAKDFAEAEIVELLEELDVYLEALLRLWSGEQQTTLKELVSAPDTIVRFAPLATIFGVPYDRALLDSRIAHARRLGPLNAVHLRAAFDALMSSYDFGALAQFISENRAQLQGLFAGNQLTGLEVEALARAGRVADAKELLESVEGLEADEKRRFADIIAEEEGADALSVRRSRFLTTNDDHDLELLIRAAIENKDTQALAEFAPELWRRRRRLADARLAVDHLFNAGRDNELEEFIVELGTAVEEDDYLRLHAAWVHFRAGNTKKAQALIASSAASESSHDNVRNLKLQLHIETGDWEGLGLLLREDLKNADQRSASQLLQAAGIAAALKTPDAFELARAAARKSSNDPGALMSAYLIALQLGNEGDETHEWFRQAIQLSGDDGPLKSLPTAELPVLLAEGRERSSTISAMLMRGELPLAVAVRPLNMTVSSLVLGNLTDNEAENDGRRRVALPFFAGNRAEFDLAKFSNPIFDHTSILVLHFLGLLEKAVSVFSKVHIPAGTMSGLLSDLSKARSVQSSRAIRAARLRALVEKKRLKVIEKEGEKAEFPGFDDELNLLAAEALRVDGTIIHPYPIHEAGSFLEKVADPAPILDKLASPNGLLNALAKTGAINPIEEDRAKRLPGFIETWPEEANVDLSRPILLDGLTVTYLSDAEILEPLIRSGADIRIASGILEIGADELEQHERAEQLAENIDAVRRTLASALASGKAVLGAAHRMDRDDVDNMPLMNALWDVGNADLVVCDDRVINRHGLFVDRQGVQIPTATTIDVIDLIASNKIIDEPQRRAFRERLRRAGSALVPVTADEIISASLRSDWSLGAPREVESIKDSIHIVLVRDMLQIPAEMHWLATTIMEIGRSIRRLWVEADEHVAVKAATYLYRCIPHQAAALLPGVTQAWAGHPAAGRLPVAAVLAGSFDIPEDRREAYQEWLEEVVLDELEAVDPLLLDSIAESLKSALLGLSFDVPASLDSLADSEGGGK